jgi:hypothetical protein
MDDETPCLSFQIGTDNPISSVATPIVSKRKRPEDEVIDLTLSELDVFNVPKYVFHEQVKLGSFSFSSWAKRHFSVFPLPEFDDYAIELCFCMFSLEVAEQEAKTIDIQVEIGRKKVASYHEWRKAIGVPLNFHDERTALFSNIAIAEKEASKEGIDKQMAAYIAKIRCQIVKLDRLLPRKRASGLEEEEEDKDLRDEDEFLRATDQQELINNVYKLKRLEKEKRSSYAMTEKRLSLEGEALDNLNFARDEVQKSFEMVTNRHIWYSMIKPTINPFDKLPAELLGVIADNLKAHEAVHFRAALGHKVGSERYQSVTSAAEKKWAAQKVTRLFTKNLFCNVKPISEAAMAMFNTLNNRIGGFHEDLYLFMERCVRFAQRSTGKELRIINIGFNVHYANGRDISFYPRALVQEEVDVLSEYKRLRENEKAFGVANTQPHCWGSKRIVEYPHPYDPREFSHNVLADFDEAFFYGKIVEDIQEEWFDDKLTFSIRKNNDGSSDIEQRQFITGYGGKATFPINNNGRIMPYDPEIHPIHAPPFEVEHEDLEEEEEDEALDEDAFDAEVVWLTESEEESEDEEDDEIIDLTDD